MSEPRPPDRIEHILAILCFGLVLMFHAWGAGVAWHNMNLPGHEFRQTQTAISAHFILQEKNYSLAYPTPVLGKPWSIPLEFPLYQWTVAKVAEVTDWPLTQVGRGVSLACFYLALPALYGLLRCLGLGRSRTLVVLAFIVSCPLYIFYARSFLMETMAWMFGCWFLLGYVIGVGRRHPFWLAVAVVGGVGAGLVKVTTLMAFLFPALAWTLVWFWQDGRGNPGAGRWAVWRGRFAWCAAAVALPIAAAWWWVRYSDRIKMQSPTGAFLESGNLASYNFGVGLRFDPAIWNQHLQVIFHEIAPVPVLVLAGLMVLLFGRARLGLIGLLVGLFFAVQLMFPLLYAWHAYYYVATAMLLMAAVGLALVGMLESRLPRGVAWLVIAGGLLGQGWAYFDCYYAEQSKVSPGGSELTVALRRVTEPDDVLIIAGNDWSSMIPYYAQRRALMIRRDLEHNWQVIDPAFAALRQEPVAALVLSGPQRENRDLLGRAVAQFQLDPRPAFTWLDTTVYLRRQYRAMDLALLADVRRIGLADVDRVTPESRLGREIDMTGWQPRHLTWLARLTPTPWKYFSTYGPNPTRYHDHDYLWAHPDTRFWFHVPAGAHRLSAVVEYIEDAYNETRPVYDRTDGAELVVWTQVPGGELREVGRRLLAPGPNPADRGRLTVAFDFSLDQAADVQFAVLPGPAGSAACDWVLLGGLRIE